MKKIVALLLSVSVILALTACGEDPCEKHVDENNDKICDVCEQKIEDDASGTAGLTVADFAAAMKDMNSGRVEISILETSEKGSLSASYKVSFGNGDSADIAYVRELWDVSEDVFETETNGKITERGELHYENGQYSGTMNGAAESVAKLALNLVKEKLASVVINGSAANGANLTAAIPRAYSADVLGVALPADAALSVTMNPGAKSISVFTLSYVADGNSIAFSVLYQ